jgi:hypothetical protein
MVVVGDPCSAFVRTMIQLSREYRLETIRCDDVYSAVVATARASGRQILVVGTIRELAREKGRFFQIAEANGQRCCCLAGRGIAHDMGGVLAAVRAGARVFADVQEVGPVLKEWLSNSGHRPRRTDLGDLRDDDLRATEAELLALLGNQADV